MSKKSKYNIAVVGATGNVGREVIKILHEVNFPIDNFYALASDKSEGKQISKNLHQTLTVKSLKSFDPSKTKVDIAFFCAGSEVSKEYIEDFTKNGCVVIDKSSLYRNDKDVPLMIPEVNLEDLINYKNKHIICTPNCTVTPLAMVLQPLNDEFKIKRVVVTTMQSVSGTGKDAMDELFYQTKSFDENGNTQEEEKLKNELAKILKQDIALSATCVRVPVFITHSLVVNVEFEKEINLEKITDIFDEQEGVVLSSIEGKNDRYLTPVEIAGSDIVFISRLRKDNAVKSGLNMWICCDNTRKGAALNGVQIAQKLIEYYL
jgi:aspartate-semialdehyde dehydrogenase